MRMADFTSMDAMGLCLFLIAWMGYHMAVESSFLSHKSLNQMMHVYRAQWMDRLLWRDVRIIDTQITAGLQNGTSFFASTSLFAIGGSLTLLRITDDAMTLFSNLPFGLTMTRTMWEIKVLGLALIFTYGFFKFAWSYRLFNYAAILIGAAPPHEESGMPQAKAFAKYTAELFTDAGRQFNRGQRALFFALAYIGWFVSPTLLMVTTIAILCVMAWRQFYSPAHDAIAALTIAAPYEESPIRDTQDQFPWPRGD
jgi:uncharacterized membrane protein